MRLLLLLAVICQQCLVQSAIINTNLPLSLSTPGSSPSQSSLFARSLKAWPKVPKYLAIDPTKHADYQYYLLKIHPILVKCPAILPFNDNQSNIRRCRFTDLEWLKLLQRVPRVFGRECAQMNVIRERCTTEIFRNKPLWTSSFCFERGMRNELSAFISHEPDMALKTLALIVDGDLVERHFKLFEFILERLFLLWDGDNIRIMHTRLPNGYLDLAALVVLTSKDTKLLRLLVERGMAFMGIEGEDYQLIHAAAANMQSLEPLEYLLTLGADVSATDKCGFTAIQSIHPDDPRKSQKRHLLLQAGAQYEDINSQIAPSSTFSDLPALIAIDEPQESAAATSAGAYSFDDSNSFDFIDFSQKIAEK